MAISISQYLICQHNNPVSNMKRLILSAIFIALSTYTFAQSEQEKTLVERVAKIENKSNAFRVQLHMRAAANGYIGKVEEAVKFSLEDFRLDIQGDITENVYYWYRQSLNRSFDGSGSYDNAQPALNVAGIGVRLGKFNIFAGRQFVAYGGYEYDYAPMNVYEFSQIINFISPYHTGIELAYRPIESQQIKFQIVNSYVKGFNDMYGEVPSHIEKAIVPFQYTVNWNGTFFDGKYNTRWSASYASVGRNKENYFYAFGNELNFGKLNMYADFYFSQEDLDSRTMMSAFAKSANGDALSALDAEYLGVVARLNYTIHPKWVILVKGMYDTASTTQGNKKLESGHYSTTYGYMGGVEFTPFKTPLRFFANYVGRRYEYTNRAKALGYDNNNTDRISLGFLYRLPVF